MTAQRRLVWFSCGAPSAVAAKLNPDAQLVCCDTGAEHPDNRRFMRDVEAWTGRKVTILKSKEYKDTWEVWEKRRFLAGIKGAPCTAELKVIPRLDFQRVDDVHIFGYTADARDIERAERLRENFFELTIETPLIERGLTKAACLDLVQRAGLEPPLTYAQGLPNANCIPCVKATSPSYWALIRRHYPAEFARMVTLSRKLNVRLTRLANERAFIDEIPADHPITTAIVPACDLLCAMADEDIANPGTVNTGAHQR